MNSISKILLTVLFVLQLIIVNGQNTFPQNGNVGIGTLTPSADLEIMDSKIPHLRISLNKYTRLELGVASGNGYFATQATPGDAVINTLGASRNLIFNTADSPGKGEAFKFVAKNKSLVTITDNASLGIGTHNPTANLHVIGKSVMEGNLHVCGQIKTKEVKVEDGWCDYVFDESYQLPTLIEEAQFIEENGHLSNFESETTMNGEIKLADVTKRQQETIEKLMLHVIEMDKEIRHLKAQIDRQ